MLTWPTVKQAHNLMYILFIGFIHGHKLLDQCFPNFVFEFYNVKITRYLIQPFDYPNPLSRLHSGVFQYCHTTPNTISILYKLQLLIHAVFDKTGILDLILDAKIGPSEVRATSGAT